MGEEIITGRDRERDATEKWLVENDPDYKEQKKKWQTPSTDALARDRTKHSTMKDLVLIGPGNYRKKRSRHTTDNQSEGFYDPESADCNNFNSEEPEF